MGHSLKTLWFYRILLLSLFFYRFFIIPKNVLKLYCFYVRFFTYFWNTVKTSNYRKILQIVFFGIYYTVYDYFDAHNFIMQLSSGFHRQVTYFTFWIVSTQFTTFAFLRKINKKIYLNYNLISFNLNKIIAEKDWSIICSFLKGFFTHPHVIPIWLSSLQNTNNILKNL